MSSSSSRRRRALQPELCCPAASPARRSSSTANDPRRWKACVARGSAHLSGWTSRLVRRCTLRASARLVEPGLTPSASHTDRALSTRSTSAWSLSSADISPVRAVVVALRAAMSTHVRGLFLDQLFFFVSEHYAMHYAAGCRQPDRQPVHGLSASPWPFSPLFAAPSPQQQQQRQRQRARLVTCAFVTSSHSRLQGPLASGRRGRVD